MSHAALPPSAPPPLSGLRVFDLSQGIAGPYCTMLMAAQGADVIKVEPPEGDWIRHGRNRVRGHAPAALAVNAGKRSIALDLKQPAALDAARALARGCDIVIESYRPGVVEKFGLDDATLRAGRADLVYCSITGFGRRGPLARRPVIDHVAQAYSGWMAVNAGADGVPQRTRNVVLADQITGLYAYQAVASALIGRLRFGTGARLDITLAGAMAAFLAPRITSHVLSDGQVGTAEFTAPTGDYTTADGLLVIAVQKPADVERLFALVGRPEVLRDERYASAEQRLRHAEGLRAELGAALRARPAAEWEAALAGEGVMACAVRDVGGFLASQRDDGLGLVDEVELPGLGACPLVQVPGAPPWSGRAVPPRPPEVGEHTRVLLAEAGLAPAQIDALAPAEARAGRRAAPEPARIPSGDRPACSTDEGRT